MTKEKTWTFHPREGWPSGEWDDEPDKVEWRDADTGAPCIVRRGPLGQWCGYVAVPPGHPWHGTNQPEPEPYVHGGVNYTEYCEPGDDDLGICHVPREGEPDDVWWLGFDCGHWRDIAPEMLATLARYHVPAETRRHLMGAGSGRFKAVYRTMDYTREECRRLAAQAAAAAVPVS